MQNSSKQIEGKYFAHIVTLLSSYATQLQHKSIKNDQYRTQPNQMHHVVSKGRNMPMCTYEGWNVEGSQNTAWRPEGNYEQKPERPKGKK